MRATAAAAGRAAAVVSVAALPVAMLGWMRWVLVSVELQAPVVWLVRMARGPVLVQGPVPLWMLVQVQVLGLVQGPARVRM